MIGTIEQHNERPAAVWSAGGKDYDEISRGIADAIEHCVRRLNPQPFERILDLGEPTAEAAWNTFSKGYGPTRALANGLDEDRRNALRGDFIAFHAGFPTELGICVPRDYWLTIGTRL